MKNKKLLYNLWLKEEVIIEIRKHNCTIIKHHIQIGDEVKMTHKRKCIFLKSSLPIWNFKDKHYNSSQINKVEK